MTRAVELTMVNLHSKIDASRFMWSKDTMDLTILKNGDMTQTLSICGG